MIAALFEDTWNFYDKLVVKYFDYFDPRLTRPKLFTPRDKHTKQKHSIGLF